MPRPYDPRSHYWIATDGRIYSGLATSIINDQDAHYVAWRNQGNAPTPWPLDEAGQQTNEALDEVLAPYLMTSTLKGTLTLYAASLRWKREVAGIVVSGVPVATDDRSKQMIMGARIAADSDPDFATPWVGVDGNVYQLNAQQIIGVSNAVLMHVAKCFGVFAQIKSNIELGALVTTKQVDMSFEQQWQTW